MMYRTYESFNESNNIKDMAWLYFLAVTYNGVMTLKSWGNDTRMGVKFIDSMKRFELQGLVYFKDDIVYSKKEAIKEVVKTFYRESMKDTFTLAAELDVHSVIDPYNGYSIGSIPKKMWQQSSTFQDEFDDWHDEFFTSWWNTNGADSVLKRYIKNNKRALNTINEYRLRDYYYPKPLPEKFTIYRGIKSDYDPAHAKGFTSWTLDKEQGERFAKWNFTKGYSTSGNESSKQTILETTIDLKDIVMFVSGQEHEVVLKEPVKVDNIIKIK